LRLKSEGELLEKSTFHASERLPDPGKHHLSFSLKSHRSKDFSRGIVRCNVNNVIILHLTISLLKSLLLWLFRVKKHMFNFILFQGKSIFSI
jgi:hypothetical protein